MSNRNEMRVAPLPDKPGFAAWFAGTIRITDPSYLRPDFPGVVPLDDLTVTFTADGLWEVTTTLMDRAPDTRTGSLVMRRVAANPKPEDTETIEIGKAAVDTKQVAIVAEGLGGIPDYEQLTELLNGVAFEGGQLLHTPNAIVVESGIGDGNYAVYATRYRDTGELLQITVDFTPSQAAWDLLYGGAA